jgi:myo-inositol-1(or 4)-monophosphatase
MEPYEFVLKAVTDAGALLLDARTREFGVSIKNNNPKDIVTTIDTKINEFLIQSVRAAFPDHSIYSEEGGDVSSESEYQWVIDPIDGSSNFSRGIPHFAVCMGLIQKGVPVLGAILNPVTKELFSFEKGKGAFLNGAPIHVSSIQSLADSHVFLHAGRKEELQSWGGESYRKLLGAAKKTSNLASSSLDACFVAAGRIEANIYGTLSTLDIAPALGLLAEAGGVMSDREGSVLAFSREPHMVFMANNPKMLEDVRTLLA